MGKAFTESDKDRVKQALLKKGREYFIRYGLKKTSVEDLSKAVGIAKGSFYRFFDSKEALFMAIHEQAEDKMRTDLLRELDIIADPAGKLRFMLKSAFVYLEDDPLLRAVFGREELSNISGIMTSDQFKEHYHENIVFLENFFQQWQDEGILKKLDIEVVSNLVASTYYIYLQKENLGEELYLRVIDMLIECLVNHLTGEDTTDLRA